MYSAVQRRFSNLWTSAVLSGCAWIAVACFSSSALAAQAVEPRAGQQGREQAALAEDQALLQRQLERLRQTMEVLAQRFESEGRTHAGKLLRDALAHLETRLPEVGAKTLVELMDVSHTSIESGRPVQAIETQERLIQGLERLYAILTDRQGVENLERSLEELRQIQVELSALAEREAELQRETAKLAEQAKSPEQVALEAGLRAALEAQRKLLAENESAARSSQSLEIEALERALDALIQRQTTDEEVMRAWKPEETRTLENAEPALEKASESLAHAQRMLQAASELRAAARRARAENADMPAVQRALEQAADREERHQRAAQDPALARTSEALRTAAEALKKSAGDPEQRARAADAIEAGASDLEKQAQAEERAARAQAEEARSQLGALPDEKSAAGRVAEAARAALPEASQIERPESTEAPASPEALQKRVAEAQRSTSQAQQALQSGMEELRTLKRALAASQAAASEEAERLARGMETMPQSGSPESKEARQSLESASEAQARSAEDLEAERAEDAADSAAKARAELEEAREAVRKMREQASSSQSSSPRSKAMQQAQEALAEKIGELAREAEQSSPSAESGQEAGEQMQGAQQSMQKAAQSMSQGQNSQAAGSQKEAISKLEKAMQAVSKGGALSRPEDKEQAEKLAAEQEEVKQKLLELASRNQKRETAEPSPSLDQAQSSASSAQESLSEGDLDSAQSEEKEAERAMRQAMRELGREEEQYQKLRQEELLFKITDQVKGLIEDHQEQMKATLEIDAQRKSGERANHTQRLRLRKIAKSEETLGGRAGEVAKAVGAEESLVFSELLERARHDLERIGRDMGDAGDYQSGERVQGLQQDVEQSLLWLLEALQNEKDRRKSEQEQKPSGGSQNQQPKNRLVPDTAELKLLRRLEMENLDSLEQLRIEHPELSEPAPAGSDAFDPLVLEDLSRLAHRHERTSDLFQKFRQRLGIPDPDHGADDAGGDEGEAVTPDAEEPR